MNAEQQKAVSQKIQRDRDFANIFMGEIMAKRKMRMDSIETAIRVAQQSKTTPDTTQTIKDAEAIYKYLVQDGQLSDLAQSGLNLV
jgi:CTP-dependent riboflavin kinase